MRGSSLVRIYAVLVRGARWLAPLFATGESKLARGVRGRRGAAGRLEGWGREERDPGRPLVWFHAPSVGEGLQARAVLEALGERRRDLQSVFTHFSPSGTALADRMPADVADYLPWDVRDDVGRVLDAVRPDVVAFTKTEVWPVLVEEARRRDIACVLVAATLPEDSSRLRWPARAVLGPTVGGLTEIMAIAEDDGARFVELGVDPERVHVTGDPGIDSAARRASQAGVTASYLRPFDEYDGPNACTTEGIIQGSSTSPVSKFRKRC